MKSVRFLHISDLHRGGTWNTEPVGEHKDPSVSKGFAETITSPMETDFINSIKRWQNIYGKLDAIVCTGDLGDKGDATKIDEGVLFIHVLQVNLGIETNNVLICPGNHDADRSQNSSHIFSGYIKALKKYSILDHCCDPAPVYINGIPFVVVNTSLGAGEKSLFIQKYKKMVDDLSPEEETDFDLELENCGAKFLDDCLDIPAITNSQRERIINAISSTETSFVILLMHHNLMPCNMVEIRPYSFVLDAGKTIEELLGTQKDVLLLHGHVHSPSSYVMCHPDNDSYISSIGTGLFNGNFGSSINIVEVFCSDEGMHIITIVYEHLKQTSGFIYNKAIHIRGRGVNDCLSKVLDFCDKCAGKGARFSDIKNEIKCSEQDLLSTVLLNDHQFRISRNNSSDPSLWVIHRKY